MKLTTSFQSFQLKITSLIFDLRHSLSSNSVWWLWFIYVINHYLCFFFFVWFLFVCFFCRLCGGRVCFTFLQWVSFWFLMYIMYYNMPQIFLGLRGLNRVHFAHRLWCTVTLNLNFIILNVWNCFSIRVKELFKPIVFLEKTTGFALFKRIFLRNRSLSNAWWFRLKTQNWEEKSVSYRKTIR